MMEFAKELKSVAWLWNNNHARVGRLEAGHDPDPFELGVFA